VGLRSCWNRATRPGSSLASLREAAAAMYAYLSLRIAVVKGVAPLQWLHNLIRPSLRSVLAAVLASAAGAIAQVPAHASMPLDPAAPPSSRLVEITHVGATLGRFNADVRVIAQHNAGFFEVLSESGSPAAPRIAASPFTDLGGRPDAGVVGHRVDSCAAEITCQSSISGDDSLLGGVMAAGRGWFRILVVLEGDHVEMSVKRALHVQIRERRDGFHRMTFQTATLDAPSFTLDAAGDAVVSGGRKGSVAVAELPCFGQSGFGTGRAQLTSSLGRTKSLSCKDRSPAVAFASREASYELAATGAWWGDTRTKLLLVNLW